MLHRREFCWRMVKGLIVLNSGHTVAALPRSAEVDAHAHVFLSDLTMADGRRYTPTYDAPTSAYLNQLDSNGIGRGVLVQPSFLGSDNSYLLAAINDHPDRLKGVAVVNPAMPERQLSRLYHNGISGVRLNLIGQPTPDFSSAATRNFLARLARIGLFAEVQVEAQRLPLIADAILHAGVRLVVDHFGRPNPRLGVADPGFRYLLSLGRERRTWVKLSGAYRLSPGARGREIASQATALLVDHLGPDRLMWGSDWPHTQFEAVANHFSARQLLDHWVPDGAVRRRILIDTPSSLFGFDAIKTRKTA